MEETVIVMKILVYTVTDSINNINTTHNKRDSTLIN